MKYARPTRRTGTARHTTYPGANFPELYAQVTRIEMTKGPKSAFPGQKFYHTFGRGVRAVGVPAGTYGMKTRAILLVGHKHLWFMQKVS